MKIIVVGSFKHIMYAKAIYDEFEKQGYETFAFDWDKYKIKGNRTFNFISRVQERLLIGPFISRTNRHLLKLVKDVNPDLVFIYRGTHIKAKTVNTIKDNGAIVFSYHNDDPFCGIPSVRYMRNYIKSAYICDYNFVYRQKNIEDFAKIGISNVKVLRSYYIKSNNFHIECKKKYDIIFAGHFENDGRDKYIKALIDAKLNVIVFGDEMWKDSPLYEEIKFVLNGPKRGTEYNKLLNDAKIALVFLSKTNSDTYTRRCFEIPATKTLMLSEYTDDLNSMFKADKEAIYFNSIEDLVNKCKYLLSNPTKISDIGNAGYERLLKDSHSIEDRVIEIVGLYLKIKNKKLQNE